MHNIDRHGYEAMTVNNYQFKLIQPVVTATL